MQFPRNQTKLDLQPTKLDDTPQKQELVPYSLI